MLLQFFSLELGVSYVVAVDSWRYLLVGRREPKLIIRKIFRCRKLLACTLPQAQVKTRRVPPVKGTLCWAAILDFLGKDGLP